MGATTLERGIARNAGEIPLQRPGSENMGAAVLFDSSFDPGDQMLGTRTPDELLRTDVNFAGTMPVHGGVSKIDHPDRPVPVGLRRDVVSRGGREIWARKNYNSVQPIRI